MSSLLTLAGNAAPTGFYNFPIEQSLRFEDGDSAYLSRTPASSGNLDAWTFSAWVKRSNIGIATTIFSAQSDVNNWMYIGFLSGDTLTWTQADGGSVTATVTTSQVFRDVSSFYHIQCTYESSEATGADRMRIYINGQRVTAFSSASYLAQNVDSRINRNTAHQIGRYISAALYFDGYLAEVNFIDGQALDPTSFGEFKSGIWIPKDTAGLTFGTNGFRLEYADSAAIGDDTSGNTNDWTVNNLVASDVVPDSPTNNFATMNPNDFALYLSEGNLKVSNSTGSGGIIARSTMLVPPNSGKWYFEGYSTVTSANGHYIGVWCPTGLNAAILSGYHDDQNFGVLSGHECVTYLSNGTIRNNSSSSTVTGLDDFDTAGDIVGVLLDMDAQTVQFYNNGSAQGSAQSLPNTTDPYGFFAAGHFSKGVIFNFGQDSTFAGLIAAGGNPDANGLGDFKYAPPSGALSPCSANLPTGAIDTLNDETPEDYFNTVLYTGTGSSNSVTGAGFEPTLTWIKNRSGAYSHQLVDQVRGKIGSDSSFARLASNLTSAEATPSGDDGLTSFDSDGFTVLGDESYNNSGQSMVAWNWKAGGTGVSNTDGSIASTVSVGATSQQNWFSVVGYSGNSVAGATVGHGLNTEPSMIIVKSRTATSGYLNWGVYHKDLGATKVIYLNTTGAESTAVGAWNNTAPTSSVFSLGNDGGFGFGISGQDYIAYCFANAEGLCKAGKFSGNGSTTDGVFVYTGFRPAYLLYKQTTAAANWEVIDNTRNPYNVSNARLFPSNSSAENTAETVVDLLSNGFKARDAYGGWNFSGQDYIYLAIAEQPFKYANAR